MFANCRGIPREEVDQTVNEAIRNLNLGKWADKLCGSYSGGEICFCNALLFNLCLILFVDNFILTFLLWM